MTVILFTGLERHLQKLIPKYRDLESKANSEILRKWYNLCNENYGLSRRRVSDYLKGDTIKEKGLTDFQYERQVGSILMPIILNFVNAFEYISTLLRMNSMMLSKELDAILSPKLDSLSRKWKEENKGIIESVTTIVRNSGHSISKQRQALRKMGLISNDDYNFLLFVWELRNAMHNNFINTRDIHYTLFDPDTERSFEYEIKAGNGIVFWDTPKWNIIITERMAEIMNNIIVRLEDIPKKKEDLKEI